jgi:hypothetical protein
LQLIEDAIARIRNNKFEDKVPELSKALHLLLMIHTGRSESVQIAFTGCTFVVSISTALSDAMHSGSTSKLEAVIEGADKAGISRDLGLRMVVARRILNRKLKVLY